MSSNLIINFTKHRGTLTKYLLDTQPALALVIKKVNMRFVEKHKLILNPDNVPEMFRFLIPIAENWGICYVESLTDYEIQQILFSEATPEEIEELFQQVEIVSGNNDHNIHDYWLNRPNEPINLEYLAFTYMIMAYSDPTANSNRENYRDKN